MFSERHAVKRYLMECPLDGHWPRPVLPAGYRVLRWNEYLLTHHAEVLARSFVDDLDGQIFPNLASPVGCRQLMESVRDCSGFCPEACWLLSGPGGAVGAIQGLLDGRHKGAIQNVGVVPTARRCGLGSVLILQALLGFRAVGAKVCQLEVTAKNRSAVTLYKRFGFRCTKVRYLPILRAREWPVVERL